MTGSTEIINIEIEKYVIRFSDTYKTMVRQQTLKIINKSSHILNFMCMKNENMYYGKIVKVKEYKHIYHGLHNFKWDFQI